MNIMLVGGISLMMRSLSIKLHKEGHRLYVLTGSRNPGNHYPHAFERYDFPYDSPSVEEVFRSVQPEDQHIPFHLLPVKAAALFPLIQHE